MAFVLLHNDAEWPNAAGPRVRAQSGRERAAARTALDDLAANCATPDAQGTRAYVRQMRVDHPELDLTTLTADAILAIGEFHRGLQAQ